MGQSTPIRRKPVVTQLDADLAAEAKFHAELARWFRVRRLPDPNTPRETWEHALELLEARLALKH